MPIHTAFVVALAVGAGLFIPNTAAAQGKASELIVGKWKAEDSKVKDAPQVAQFNKDGTMSMAVGGALLSVEGKYKFVGADTVELTIDFQGMKSSSKIKVEVTKDTLVTTGTTLDGKAEVIKYKRVADKK